MGLKKQHEKDSFRSDRSGEERFIIPQANLLELVRIEEAEMKKRVENVHGTPVFHHRGKLVPLIYLGKVLGVISEVQHRDAINVVVLQAESKQLGLVVDSIWDTQEIVVKPLGRQLKGLNCYVGATIMGDGRPALILDVAGLARLAQLGLQSRPPAAATSSPVKAAFQAEPQMMLLFRAKRYERMAVSLGLVDRLEEVKLSQIEHSGGRPVLHYRGEILPLLSVDPETTGLEDKQRDASLQIIVFTNGTQRVGLVVDQILDIVHEVITGRRSSSAPSVLGSAVIGGKITDLLDLPSLVASIGEDWLMAESLASVKRSKLLLIDSSPFSREILGERLVTSGYDVISVSCAAEVLQRAREQSGFAAMLVSTHAADRQREELAKAVRTDEALAKLPTLELVDDLSHVNDVSLFDIQFLRSDITGVLARLPEMMAAGAEEVAA